MKSYSFMEQAEEEDEGTLLVRELNELYRMSCLRRSESLSNGILKDSQNTQNSPIKPVVTLRPPPLIRKPIPLPLKKTPSSPKIETVSIAPQIKQHVIAFSKVVTVEDRFQKPRSKFDLTKDNDFERFIYEQPRSFVTIPVSPPPKKRIRTPSPIRSCPLPEQKRLRSPSPLVVVSNCTNEPETTTPERPFSKESLELIGDALIKTTDHDSHDLKDMSISPTYIEPIELELPTNHKLEIKTKSIPPPKTPPFESEDEDIYCFDRPMIDFRSAGDFESLPNVKNRRTRCGKFDESMAVKLKPLFQSKSLPHCYRRSSSDDTTNSQNASGSISPPPPPSLLPSYVYNSSGHSSSFHRGHKAIPKKGYPTYYERFLATIFSWNPMWIENPALNFGDKNDELCLPNSYAWLEESMDAIAINKFRFRDYLGFKAVCIPYLLLNLFKTVHNSLPLALERDYIAAYTRRFTDLKTTDFSEKSFLTELRVVVNPTQGDGRSVLKEGDLVILRSVHDKTYQYLALVTYSNLVKERNTFNKKLPLETVTEFEYALVIKRTVCNKLRNESKFHLQLVANIDSYLLEAQGVYDLVKESKYAQCLIQTPTVPNLEECAQSNVVDISTATDFNQKERDVIRLVTLYTQTPLSETEKILAITPTIAADEERRIALFVEMIASVDSGQRLIAILPNDDCLKMVTTKLSERLVDDSNLFVLGSEWDQDLICDNWAQVVDLYKQEFCELYAGRREIDWTQIDVIRHLLFCGVDKYELDMRPEEYKVLEDMVQNLLVDKLRKCRIVLTTLATLQVKRRADLISSHVNYRTGLVYDTGLSDVQITSLCVCYPISTLLVVADTTQRYSWDDGEVEIVRPRFQPKTFIERLSDSSSTFTF